MERPERAVIHRYQDADGNWYRGLGPTARWSASPPMAGRIAPRLGEHSDEILQELGLSC
ncbi:hypothetical protein D3C81_2292250 [compost metagenome]